MTHSIIDTHVHVWDLGLAEYAWLKGASTILNRSYVLGELEVERIRAGVTGGVLVQAANHLMDTDHMLRVARGSHWIRGVVGWLPLTDPEATGRLLADDYVRDPLFKGVRHLIHDEADPRWLLQPTVLESLAILAAYDIPYDLVGALPDHIDTALRVAERVPTLRMVFDHINQPPISSKGQFGRWGEWMSVAAGHSGFHVKISGLGTAGGDFSSRRAEDILPFVRFVVERFGVERCMCGGDWPVSLLAKDYADTWSMNRWLVQAAAGEAAAGAILSANAHRFYTL